MNIGILGCGYISNVYIENTSYLNSINIVGCADLNNSRALETSVRYGVSCYSVSELINSSKVDLILNLTPPRAHFDSSMAIAAAGKHVYVEKPLSISSSQAKKLLNFADKSGVRVGVAPDTFMGDPIQTAKAIIDDGEIGRPLGVNAFMLKSGPEKWHPDPEFFYQHGSGPMYDMGPYYVTALVHLLGPVRSVSATSSMIPINRKIAKGYKKGTKITVETPTHISGSLEFSNGVVGTLVTSFDVMNTALPNIEIYGTGGTIIIPDPNTFTGEVLIVKDKSNGWKKRIYKSDRFNGRGMGLANMAEAIESNKYHEANGNLGLHVLEVLEGFHLSIKSRKYYNLQTNYLLTEERSI